MKKYVMDTHKLYWHLDRVNSWQKGERIVPITIDVGLSKGCNIHCEYCFGGMQGNKFQKGLNDYFPREALINYVKDAGTLGVRSMALIGEGEPLLNPHVYEAIIEGRAAGVDMSMGTNGILYDKGANGIEALKNLTWLRFNISASSKEGYRKIHNSEDFEQALDKISFCVETKNKYKLDTTIGLQMVLTPSNLDQVIGLAKMGRELGVDYFVVKQCSDSTDSFLGIYDKLSEYKSFEQVLREAEQESTKNYEVIVKWNYVTNEGARNYTECLGTPFLVNSSGDGRLYPCGAFFFDQEEEYRMGDFTKQSFIEIWNSDRYWSVVDKVAKINVNTCHSTCRKHAINDFLYKLKNKPEHVNFI